MSGLGLAQPGLRTKRTRIVLTSAAGVAPDSTLERAGLMGLRFQDRSAFQADGGGGFLRDGGTCTAFRTGEQLVLGEPVPEARNRHSGNIGGDGRACNRPPGPFPSRQPAT
jgi:hypothetical protein